MKIMICGKGGCGKSTLTVLLARGLTEKGKRVLVVDADESNLCLHRLLGAKQPEIMMDAMGGRQGTREQLKQVADHQHDQSLFHDVMRFDNLPDGCVTEIDGIQLLVVGKIKAFGEGCACMIGGISKALLERLEEKDNEIVLIDAEAGLEHFGRQVDKNCDMVLSIIDPSYESIQMAQRTAEIAKSAGVQSFFILNKVDETTKTFMQDNLDRKRVIGTIERSEELFLLSLKGEPLATKMEQIESPCNFIAQYRKPLSLNMAL